MIIHLNIKNKLEKSLEKSSKIIGIWYIRTNACYAFNYKSIEIL